MAKLTGINKLCECIFALAVTHSSHPELRQSARENLRGSLPDLLDSYLGQNSAAATAAASGLHEISFDLLQYLLCCLSEYVSPQLESQFLNKLREEFPREAVPLVLAPLLYRSPTTATTTTATAAKSTESTDAEEETTNTSSWSSSNADNLNEVGIEDIYDHLCEIIFTNQVRAQLSVQFICRLFFTNNFTIYSHILQGKNNIMDTSWINLILEIGYEFTSSVEDCKNHLCCGAGGSRELQPKDVAKIVGLMCRRHSSLLDCNVNLPTPANFWPGQGQQAAGSSSSNTSQTAQQNSSSNNNNDGSSETSSAASEKKDKKDTTDATQTWKPDVFVQALKELVPQLNWKEVCMGKCQKQDYLLAK